MPLLGLLMSACTVRSSISRFLCVAYVLLSLISETASAEDRTWSTKATIDLHAIHDIVSADHPGPVDPENPGYKLWLEQGLSAALRVAPEVKSQADYVRTVAGYTAGFRDNHLAVEPKDLRYEWPGFLTSLQSDRVVLTAKDQSVAMPIGAELTSCDGVSAATLMQRFVYSYRTNPDVPQTRNIEAPRLFTVANGDEQAPQHCKFQVGGKAASLRLLYRPISRDDMFKWIDKARGIVTPPLQAEEIGDVWLISIPTFDWFSADARQMEAFIGRLKELSATLHAARVVALDVRGNGGGNGEWGERVLAALFGDDGEGKIRRSFDETVDWRASPDNEQELRRIAKWERSSGLDGAEVSKVADGVAAAVRDHQVYFRQIAPATYQVPKGGQPSPFTGKVYLLTDDSCASACLEFAEELLRFHGVEHVGLPTNADAVYIDIAHVPLPSGAANLRYGLKVYRNRSRKNNEWLTPRILWDGGPMTDESVAAWLTTLPRKVANQPSNP